MNKNILIFIVIFIVAFVSGLIGSLYIGGLATNHALFKAANMAETLNPSSDTQRRAELWARFALSINHNVRNSNKKGALDTLCLMLNMSYFQLNPNAWDSDQKKEEIIKLKKESRVAREQMNKEGICEI